MIAEEEYAREKLVDADFCQLQMTAVHVRIVCGVIVLDLL